MTFFRAVDLRIIVTLAISYLFGTLLVDLVPLVLSRGMIAFFLLPLIALFFLLMLIRPQIALFLILLLRASIDPLIEMTRGGDQQMGLGAGINLVVILLACIMFLRNRPYWRSVSFLFYWVLFLGICFCAVFYSPIPFRAFRLFLNFVTYFCMALFPFILIDKITDKYFWLKCLLASSVGPVLLGNCQFIITRANAERILGSFQHPNIFAFFLVLMIVIAFILLRADTIVISSFWKNVLKIYLVNLFFMLLLTKTRNAWIACWLIFFIYGVLVNRKLLLMVVLLPFVVLLIPSLQQRIMDLFSGNDITQTSGLNSFAWRRRLWADSLPVIAKRPIEGHGLSSFVPMSQTFSAFADKSGVGAHNTYLEIIFETGLLGLSAFVGIWVSLLQFFKRFVKSSEGNLRGEYVLALGYVISYAVVCSADNMNYYLVSNWYTWFFIGVMAACACKFSNKENNILS